MTKQKEVQTKSGYSKAQLLKSKKYSGIEKNILDITLDENQKYTHDQARKAINDFNNRKVK